MIKIYLLPKLLLIYSKLLMKVLIWHINYVHVRRLYKDLGVLEKLSYNSINMGFKKSLMNIRYQYLSWLPYVIILWHCMIIQNNMQKDYNP